jgi:hypothetical protein
MKQKQLLIGGAAFVLSIALLLIQGGNSAPSVRAFQPTALTDLNNLEQLKQVFQRDQGTVRLVALLSPT